MSRKDCPKPWRSSPTGTLQLIRGFLSTSARDAGSMTISPTAVQNPFAESPRFSVSRSGEVDITARTVALLPFGNVIEDFLDTLGLSLESFAQEFTGSWMFGYVDAFRRAGVRTVLICVSAQVRKPTQFVHGPTGATIHVLPALRSYRVLRS